MSLILRHRCRTWISGITTPHVVQTIIPNTKTPGAKEFLFSLYVMINEYKQRI